MVAGLCSTCVVGHHALMHACLVQVAVSVYPDVILKWGPSYFGDPDPHFHMKSGTLVTYFL